MSTMTIFYFFLTIKRHSFILFLLLSLLLTVHSFIVDSYFYTYLLFVYLVVLSIFYLSRTFLYTYLGVNLVIIFTFGYLHTSHYIEGMMIFGFLAFLAVVTHFLYTQQRSYIDEQKHLEGEILQLKRMNISAEQAPRLEERTRIMRDLHDSVGHKLTALIMKLEMLAIQTRDAQYREVKKMAEDSLAETREAVSVLKSDQNQGIGTVVQLIRKLESESHLIVKFTLKEGVLATKLSNEQNIQLYRIIQEALTNAMRHSHSREVEVSLGKTAVGHISFDIRNRVYEAKPFEFGFGLTNMEERVKAIGGKLSVYQTDTQFIVSGSFPIEEHSCNEDI